MSSLHYLRFLWLFLFSLATPWASGQFFSEPAKVTASLVAETKSIEPGKAFSLGLLLKHEPHWHTYWRNPGDAGLATQLKLDLPASYQVSEFSWPTPKTYVQSGLVNYVYEGDVLLMFEVTPPAGESLPTSLKIEGKARWLECDDEQCVPGSEVVSLTLPVQKGSAEASSFAELFRKTRAQLPQPLPDTWEVKAYREGERRFITVEGKEGSPSQKLADLYFYANDAHIAPSAPQKLSHLGGGRSLLELAAADTEAADSAKLTGVLVTQAGWGNKGITGMAVDALLLDEPYPAASETVSAIADESGKETSEGSLLPILGLAFLGGMILNLMPCVFPVIGLKILGFVEQAGQARSKVALHGLIFTLGVLIGFWVLAGLLIVLRQGGQELGWGFQLQSPNFVISLTVLLLVFGLSLSGVFELGYGAASVGGELSRKSGLAGSFFSGLLATVVATPCAAPFLAPALGAALALPPAQALVTFTAMGLGLSAPYIALSVFPGAVKLLPRPGAWMDTFKQLMAFPLYATVAFLLWTLAGLVGEERLLNILLSLVSVALACWLYGHWGKPTASKQSRVTAIIVALLIAGSGALLAFSVPHKLEWQKWSPEKVEELIAAKKPFYIDFTARWCLTCKVNKKRVFGSEEVLAQFQKEKVTLLKADWTNEDENITRALAAYGRSAVPFNLIYGPALDEPMELPETLGPDTVLEALSTAVGK